MDGQPTLVGPKDGNAVSWGGFGARFIIGGETTGERFSIVEHPIAPRSLAAPVHTHTREDEHSWIIEGEIGMQLGDQVITARPGDFVFKPRDVPHAFWNATDKPARMLEIISPAGFERYFEEIAPLLNTGGPPDLEALGALREKYGLSMDMASRPILVERYGLTG
jgi:quercetin dioxygenase-like cupin family protein